MKNIPNDCKDIKVALIKHQGDTDRREQLSSPEFTERTWIKEQVIICTQSLQKTGRHQRGQGVVCPSLLWVKA